jgi:hypothetical protein
MQIADVLREGESSSVKGRDGRPEERSDEGRLEE